MGMMMQQLLQAMQIHGNALNQFSTDVNTRMDNFFTELNTKYDDVSNHIKRIDVQLVQTAESVKRQQGILPGKSAMNPRVEHCNAAELRLTAPDELAETPPVRVYVPKVPYPIPPIHLMDLISVEQLAGFRKMVRRLPQNISFEHAWEIRQLHMFFKKCRESQEDIKALFTEALTPSLKEALCDSGSSVNLISKAILDELSIVDVEPSLVTLTFANSSMTVPYGTIRNLPVQVGNCILHTKFQVVDMSKDHEMPLIFERSFMATVGAVVDMPNKRVSFSNINKKVFYKALPTSSQIRYASCISVVSGEQLDIVPKKELGKKGEIKEVLDGDPHTDTKKLSRNAKVNEKFQKKRVKGDPMMTLIPRLCDEKSIEYEVKCKDTSKPFSKVRVILTHEPKEKGEAAVKGFQASDLNQALGGRQPTGGSNGTTCPLKRAVVPGDHLTIEHPEFSWSARSTQGCCEVSLEEGFRRLLTRFFLLMTLAVAKDTHVDLELPDISHLILQKFSANQVTLVSYVQICAKRSERKGSTQPLTRYCCRNSVRMENKQIKGATARLPMNCARAGVENQNHQWHSETSCITSFFVTSPYQSGVALDGRSENSAICVTEVYLTPPKPTLEPGNMCALFIVVKVSIGTNAGRKSLAEDKGPDVPADVPAAVPAYASSSEDKAPEPSLVLLDKNQSTVSDLQKEDARYLEKRDAALALCRAKTRPVIISNRKLYPGYNPFAPIDKKRLKELADWLKTCPHYRTALDKKPCKSRTWWYQILRTSLEWLEDCVSHLHIDAWINVLRKRYGANPQHFKSERMCFLDHLFAQQWRFNFKDFKDSEPDQNGLGRRLPCVIIMQALYHHFANQTSICSSISPEELDVVMEPFLYRVPYLLVECASSDEVRAQYSLEPFRNERLTNIPPARAGDCGVYTLKYIECHALGIEFSKKYFAKPNRKSIRDKMVVDIFQELPNVHEFENKDMDDIL
uniref:Ubiquitin-like protease family profile domain-containing protein n=1 Tax=Brassica oleracea var. oleracea TaxID=109376 RepID=A0A0D3A8P3_BRAOL